MTDSSDSRPSAQILQFRQAAKSRPEGWESPVGRRPISTGERFVYDVVEDGPTVVVTYRGSVITRHDDRDTALANARLIAGNFWAEGIPTSVRWINADGTIQPIVCFG